MSFSEKFQDTMYLIAEKVDDNQYLAAIKNAFTAYMPFIIIGSFATLLKILLCSTQVGLAKFVPALEGLTPAFNAVNFTTMSLMALPIVFLVAMNLAKRDKLPEHLAGVVALCSYVAVVPQTVSIAVAELDKVVSAAGLGGGTLGAQGLFVGMMIAILSEKFLKKLMSIEAIKIKMPASVPAAISQSFNVLIPVLILLCTVAIGGLLFQNVAGVYINEWIYQIVQKPMEFLFQSPVGIVAVMIISQLFWFLGIHGGLIVSPIRNPLCAAALAANTAAVAAGMAPDQPVTMGFWSVFNVAGGAGMIFSLLIAIFMFSKREDHKMIAKLGFVPALCGISEPVVFGLPLVMNPTFAIPFIFNSGIATAIAMFATSIGFLPCNVADAPFGLPLIVNAFYGHGWQGVIVQVIILVVTTLVWIPFVLASNKQKQD